MSRTIVRSIQVLIALLLLSPLASSQVAPAEPDKYTEKPAAGLGHDLLGDLNETVSPTTGQVVIGINVPVPPGRKLTVPFGIEYNSGSVWQSQQPPIQSIGLRFWQPTLFWQKGGWSYSLPSLSATYGSNSYNCNGPTLPPCVCHYARRYAFQDPVTGSHSLGLAVSQHGTQCTGDTQYSTLQGGDVLFTGATSDQSPNTSFGPFPTTVFGRDGTKFHFGNPYGGVVDTSSLDVSYSGIANYVEDRNGNRVSYSGITSSGAFAITDTLGRQAITSTGFGQSGDQISVSGLANPYTLTWSQVPANFSVDVTVLYSANTTCRTTATGGTMVPAVTNLTLANGRQYQFQYDSTFGLISKIIYPTGGYIRYTWSVDPQTEEALYQETVTASGVTNILDCYYRYGVPRLAKRFVSFDGSTEVLRQEFSYAVTWDSNNGEVSRQTTVMTFDLSRGTSFKTIYTYSPPQKFSSPYYTTDSGSPLEKSIQYFDLNGQSLKTVNKTWVSGFLMQSQTTVLPVGGNSIASESSYSYDSLGQLQEVDQYDFGTPSAQPAPGPLLRKTSYTYASFTGTNIRLLDFPASKVTYNSAGSRAAEKDYAYDGVPVSAAQNCSGHDETNYGLNSTLPRANMTQKTEWSNAGGSPIATYTYDETGQLLTTTDACGNATCNDMTGTSHTTTFSYADSFDSPPSSSTNAYLTRVTNALGQSSSFKYAYSDGQLIQSTDPNGQVTSYLYADSLRRLTETDYPDGGKTTLAYNDATYNSSTPSPNVTTTRLGSPSPNLTTLTAFDGMGHVVRSVITSDPGCATGDRTDTIYDGMGRVYKVSNPYCSSTDPTYGITTYAYDALGHPSSETEQDGSIVSTTYSGNCTTVTDEASKARKSCADALGRLATVNEDPAGLNYLTSYTYDALSNLTSVVQTGLGQRTFVYDSLSRLTSATNPESGTVTYAYDPNGNLTSKTAPAPNQTAAATVTTTYSYDALNRLTQKSYSDTTPTYANGTPTVLYGYDQSSVTLNHTYNITNSIGRLSWSAPIDQNFFPISMNAFSYDPLGRTTQFWQEPPATRGVKDQVIFYIYDLIGNNVQFFIAADQAAPEGVIEQLTYDGAGHLTTFFENVTAAPSFSSTMISGITYNALGQRTSATFANGLTQSWKYNKRGFVTNMAAGTGCSAGNCTTSKYGYTLGYAPNGNVTSANDTVNGNWNYSYDVLNRLVCSNLAANGTCPTTGTPTYSYTYDRFGNRLHQTGPIKFNATFTGSNNRIDGYCYDSAGNLLDAAPCPTGTNPVHAFKYDAENRLVTTSLFGTNYIYDAQGRRVEKATTTTLEDYLYDKDGNIISNWVTNSPSYAEYYANGWHFMTEYVNAAHNAETEYFQHSDWLGTERMRTDINGNIAETCASLPFGDGLNCTGPIDVSPMHFTGKERDSESGLDNFGGRYNSSSMGRFMTPDPLLNSGHPSNPQTWNRYAYTLNNPLNIVDPTGLYNLVNNCASDDKKCNKQFQQNSERLKNGVSDLQKAADKEKDPVKKARLEASLKALGTENDGNNVNVSFGALKGDAAGHTDTVYNDKTGGLSFNVTFDPSKISSQNSQAIDAAHEGTHITDISDPRYASGQLSDFSDEYRAYQTSAWAASALGLSSLSFGKNGSYPIWNSSWATVDDKVLTRYITESYKYSNGQPYKETTPHNPWDN